MVVFIGLLTFVFLKSIIIPKAMTAQAIMFLGKPYAYIGNIENKTVDSDSGLILDKTNSRINVYFFLYPFFKPYRRKIKYTKVKKIGEESYDETIVWKTEGNKEIIVSKTNISDHVRFKVDYPMVVPNLELKELGTVNVLTNNVIEIKDLSKWLFGVEDALSVSMDSLSGALRGIVASKTINELNGLASESKGDFNDKMQECNHRISSHPGLEDFGAELVKSIFKDFEPADSETKNLMNSNLLIEVAKNQAKEKIEKQKGDSEVYEMQKDSEISKEKERRVKIGVAKTDDKGNITELVPDANTRIIAEKLGELKDLNGTLVIGGDNANFLNLKNKRTDE